MPRPRTVVVLLASVAMFALATASAAQAATLGPRLLGGPGVEAKPPRIGVGAKGVWERLRWSDWDKRRPTARGVYDIAGFAGRPGTGYRSRISLKLMVRKTCKNGSRIYTRVRWRVRKSLGGRRVFTETFSTCRR